MVGEGAAYPSPMRVGVIDMGTNSTRLLLAEVANGEIDEIERLLTITRLGAHVDRDGRLGESAMGRTRKTVTDYVERARSANCKGKVDLRPEEFAQSSPLTTPT